MRWPARARATGGVRSRRRGSPGTGANEPRRSNSALDHQRLSGRDVEQRLGLVGHEFIHRLGAGCRRPSCRTTAWTSCASSGLPAAAATAGAGVSVDPEPLDNDGERNRQIVDVN